MSNIHNGDDSIAVKALDDYDSTCTRNVVVENCHFELGHGASIGSVGSGCVENVIFRHITMDKMENGCRIKARTAPSGRGKVKNITWSNIQIKTTKRCVTVTTGYDKSSPTKQNDDFVEIKDVILEHITGHHCKIGAEFLCKEPGGSKQ